MISLLVVFLYLASIGLLVVLAALLSRYCWWAAVIVQLLPESRRQCQIPVTIIAALLLGLRWVSRARADP